MSMLAGPERQAGTMHPHALMPGRTRCKAGAERGFPIWVAVASPCAMAGPPGARAALREQPRAELQGAIHASEADRGLGAAEQAPRVRTLPRRGRGAATYAAGRRGGGLWAQLMPACARTGGHLAGAIARRCPLLPRTRRTKRAKSTIQYVSTDESTMCNRS